MRLCTPRAATLDGRMYLVVADPTRAEGMEIGDDADDTGDRDAPPVMRLEILDLSAVEDLDDETPVHGLDDAAEG
jgi:hypothetical protein